MTALTPHPATYDDFLRLAQGATVVPVAVTLPADIHTPVGVFLKTAGQAADVCLFETHRLDRRLPPYTFIGLAPRWVITGRDGKVELRTPYATLERSESLLQAARRRLRADILAPLETIPRLASGAFGYLAHEAAYQLHNIPPRTPPTVEGVLAAFSTVIVFDHVRQRLHIVVNVATDGRTERLETAYAEACAAIRTVVRQLEGPFPALPTATPAGRHAIVTPLTPDQFRLAAERTEQRIRRGELHCATLAQRLERPLTAPPFSAYRLLRIALEAPATFFFASGGTAIFGGATDNLVHARREMLRAYVATHERPPGATEAETALAAAELAADEAAAGQHLLFVDDLRNDLGQVAAYGSVELETLANVEQTPTHLRLISILQAQLAAERDYLDVLAVRLPSALWTGLPKRPALRLTTELEPVRRHHFGSQFCLLASPDELIACETQQLVEVTGRVARFHAFASLTGDTDLSAALVSGAKTAQRIAAALEQAEHGRPFLA
ncbi:MAG: chorismate-binding protein [Chloracidobacterium sp.]|nr:chorismate-binding protein [Chloracidobacterium sp.]MDW8215975.1 chorismate-binding protein [Acidobacteriota bacterium]